MIFLNYKFYNIILLCLTYLPQFFTGILSQMVYFGNILQNRQGLPEMLMIRKYFPDGMLMDYFDHPNTIGWVKRNEALNTLFGVLMSNGGAGEKRMEFGNAYAGKILVDALNRCTTPVKIDENGWAVVYTNERSVSRCGCWRK